MIHQIKSSIRLTLYASLAPIALAACAAAPSVQDSTPSKTYNASVDQVYQASIEAFQNLGLEVFKEDKAALYVEGGRQPAFGQGSEKVGVFLESVGPSQTIVRIDNNRAVLGIVFSEDWTDDLFNQITNEIEG